MLIKNRLSPYPILDDFGDDYIDSSFDVEYEVNTQFREIYGKLSFKLNNDDIQKLILEEKAEFLVHVEGPTTCYREAFFSFEPEIEFKLNAESVSKVIEIRSFIVLKENLSGYSSEKFHPDYDGQTFDLQAHQIIAIGTAKNFDVQKDDRDLETLPSIIQITKMNDIKKGSLSVDTDNNNYVLVGLSENVYAQYAQLGKTIFKASVFSLVLLPALMVVIQRMHINKDDPDMNSRHWFQVINTLLSKNGFDIDDISIDDNSLLVVCQAIFSDPIARSFKELDECSERM